MNVAVVNYYENWWFFFTYMSVLCIFFLENLQHLHNIVCVYINKAIRIAIVEIEDILPQKNLTGDAYLLMDL